MVRALAITGRDEKAAVQVVATPEPGAGQVRVAVKAASVNGIDAATAAGYLWDMVPHEFPVVLGRDFAGVVDAVGDDVTTLKPGDRVAGVITGVSFDAGALVEQLTIDAAALAVVPAGVSFTDAAALGLAGITAGDLLDALHLTADDVVLVSGATGGVGALAVQLAAATRATVIATGRAGESTEFVRGLGATAGVDYTGDLAAAVGTAAPQGVTAIVHASGDAATLAALLRKHGRLASALGANAEQVGRDDVVLTGVLAASTPDKLAALLTAVSTGTLRVPVAATFDFGDADQALEAFGSHKLGKLVVTAS